MIREYPAYGRTIAAHIVRGLKPVAVGVLLSSRWWYFDHAPKVCLRPDEWRPGHYEFGFLGGVHAVAIAGEDCRPLFLAELLVDLMAAAPRLLWAYDFTGKKLYDGDFASDIALWVRELMVDAGVDWRERWPRVQAAAARMHRAQAKALADWQREWERLQEKGTLAASIRFAQAEAALKDRVRALFSTPERVDGAQAA